ncbi:MAG: phosphopyruvate hydratase [Burkholderiaceae bacterium]|nr:phosphopyruvate hydratase [Burkholderiaceae bacterium]
MTQARIEATIPRRVWDSRGRPTIEVEVRLSDGSLGRGIAPAGASRGSREAIDRRDGGERLGGLDVREALAAIELEVAPALASTVLTGPLAADEILLRLDDTPTKSVLGGNVTVATSIACAHAYAASVGLPLWRVLADDARPSGDAQVSIPLPEIQIFGGGAHAGRRIDIQDLMVIARGASSVEQALAMTAEVYLAAGRLMAQRGAATGVADEGGHWPAFESNEHAIETLLRAIEAAGYTAGDEVAISLDIAASEFGARGQYRLGLDKQTIDSDGMIDLLGRWLERYPICSIEDPLAEDDLEGMRAFTQAWGKRIQIIGDDFLVTNAALIDAAAAGGACNAALIKPNQAGTLSEARDALGAARKANWSTVVSARSGETEDTTICDLAIGWNARQLKVGSITRGERTAKWNALIRAEQALGAAAFADGRWLRVSNAGSP